MPSVSPARAAAIRVLHRVIHDGAWLAPTLDAEIRDSELDPRDAALATEITYGVVRALPWIDRALAPHLRRPERTDARVRTVLRAAAYQLLALDRVPPHAVVDDAVAWVRRERGPRVGGFVNAVLRKVAAEGTSPAPEGLVVPAWMDRALERGLGAQRRDAFVRGRPVPPPLGLRVTGETRRAEVVEAIRRARPRAEVREGRVSPRAVLVRRAGDPRALPGWLKGRITVQEEGSQVVGSWVAVRPGERVADACAGHGGKTLQLAEATGPSGRVVAFDRDAGRLEDVEPERVRLGITPGCVETRVLDVTSEAAEAEGPFDRVLVDAPCTNLGTLHRRPELRLRLGEDDLGRLAELQRTLVTSVARWLRPGGVLVYAVCSPTREEGIEVAEALEAARPELTRISGGEVGMPELRADGDGVLRLGPWQDPETGPDAYQVICWHHAGSSPGGLR